MRKLILLLIAGLFCADLNAQTSVRDQDGLFFTIQVGSFLTMPSMNAFRSTGQPVIHDLSVEGMNRISLGRFKSFGEAEQFLTKLKSGAIFSDAFITSYLDGSKITIADARGMNQVTDPAAAERAAAYAKAEEEARLKADAEMEAEKATAEAEAKAAAEAQAEKERQELAAKAKADSLYEARATEEAEAEVARITAIAKAKEDSLEAAKQAIPEGLAVVHHNTKMDSIGVHELTEKDGVMVEESGAASPAEEAKSAKPVNATSPAAQKQAALDSMLALTVEGQKASTTGGMVAEEVASVNHIFNIEGKKILFSDTISDRLTGPEFVYNLKKGDQMIISANEVKGKAFKGYRVFRYDNQMDKFDKELPVGELDMKSPTISEEMVNINRDGIYKVKIIQPTNSFRIMSVLIEKRSKEDANLVAPFSTNREPSFVYEKNEDGKTAINTSAISYYQRKKNAGSEYSPSDIFIHEKEIDDFEKHQKRGDQYQVSCCPSSKEYNKQYGIDRPITNIFKFFRGDTILVEFSHLLDSKGKPTKFKSIDLKRYGSEETIYTTKDVGGKRFAFIAGKTGYYDLSFDTYRPDEYTVSGIMTRIPHSSADASFVNEVDPEVIPVYFYEYNSFTKTEDLKFAIAPTPHVEANISTE